MGKILIVLVLILVKVQSVLAETTGMNNYDEMTLYFIPSPYGLDWDTPASITRTTIKNEITLKDRHIGHVAIELKCTDGTHLITGMTGDVSVAKKLLFREGLGLGLLFYNFNGSIETTEKLKSEIEIKAKQGRLSFLQFKIKSATCKRLVQYVNEFTSKGYMANYALPHRPRYGEGSGCSAFGASFIELAGLMEEEFKNAWSRHLRVPEKYIGKPISDKKVPITSLLLPLSKTSWAEENEPHRKIFFWSPDDMHEWVLKKIKNDFPKEYQITKRDNAWGLIYDRTHIETPNGPIFQN